MKGKNYIIEFDKLYKNGDVYRKGCFTNLDKMGLKEDQKGIYKTNLNE